MPLQVISVPVRSLTENPHNARRHPDSQVDQLVQSIREFGWTTPILIDENDVILAGHGRLQAARKLRSTHVPAIRLEHLTEVQKRALVLADNKIAANAAFDMDILALELAALNDEGFSLDLTGFSATEFNDILASCVPTNLQDIDDAGKDKAKPDTNDETADWPKVSLKVPPEVEQVYLDLLARAPGAKPHEKFEALLSAVDILALEELARAQQKS
jgi:ParB-like chromosome segregation protein Spo0J